ncbi:MAG: argininosuccinate synthase [Planctomycetota bacterium]
MAKVVLAYSGGLDTSVIVHWLTHQKDMEVITFCADLGEGPDMKTINTRAKGSGAVKTYSADLRKVFLEEYCWPALKADAIYEGRYVLATALGRPLIAAELVKIAKKEKAEYIAHGCTGKGNDQVRIETTAAALAPELKMVAPLRTWDMKSREDEIDYAVANKIPIDIKKKNPFSIDANLWGRAIECGAIEDPWAEAPEAAWSMTTDPAKAPAKPEYVEIGFKEGVPTSVNGKATGAVKLIETLNELGGKHGVGRYDCLENRLVGIKSREIYEAPGAAILFEAHKGLCELVLSKDLAHFSRGPSQKMAELIYNGLWFSELRLALSQYFDFANRFVTGKVRVKLYRGHCMTVGRYSDASQYNMELATYTEEDIFKHTSAEGFIDIWSLPLRVQSQQREVASPAKVRRGKK